jgi:hypothetical protein
MFVLWTCGIVSTSRLRVRALNRKERGAGRLLSGVFARENFRRSRDTENETWVERKRFFLEDLQYCR